MNFLPSLCTTAAIFLISYSSVFAAVPCAPVRTRPCPGENPKASLVHVFISDCFDEPCAFKRGQNVTLEMDIDFTGSVQRLEAALYAMLTPGAPIKWDGINKEACQNILSPKDCPFDSGDYVMYGVDLFILPNYPTVRTDVKFMLLDELGETQVCWMVKAQVS